MTHVESRTISKFFGRAIAGLLALFVLATAVSAQAPPDPLPAQQNIEAGAIVIPMDNINQGNAGGTTFNLRAYGLANLLLQNNIPVKWAIKPDKSKDATDFAANVTRIAGAAGVAGPANVNFSGGPFVIQKEYDTPSLRSLISTFNGGGTAVTVYKTNADVLVDVRYTLTHKPKLAIGPDGGNFGAGVHQDILNAAGIGPQYYDSVTDDLINQNSCYTMATQAHSASSSFVNLYRQFVQSGGNLLLQCLSISTFENNPNGHFQALVPGNPNLPGFLVFGTNDDTAVNTTLVYPEGSMPFNQFIGAIANQDGAVTEYQLAPNAIAVNGMRISVHNNNPDWDKIVASVSQLLGPSHEGGVVFEMGGHDYQRTNTGASLIERLNGMRMFLNAVFVPVSRPQSCGLQQAAVLGYKSVRRIVNFDGGPVGSGDTLRWTIDYINNSPVDVTNFQIRDIIGDDLKISPGVPPPPVKVTFVSAGSIAVANPDWDGIGNDASSDLLLPGALLKAGGRIQVTVDMEIVFNVGGTPLPNGTILRNQAIARGDQLVTTVLTDNIDATNVDIFGPGTTPHPDSVLQNQNPASIDPTIVVIKAPTSALATLDGIVRDAHGNGIVNATITIMNASTGAVTTVFTGSFGYYFAQELPAGDTYVVSVSHRRYRFPNSVVSFTLNDSVSGLSFVASPLGVSSTKGGK
jgi:uncharacterized repeat protein (TIGR01451 family)